ncbi:MAG: helicase associated domain-containing protein, partial [Chthoniobacteraceae bacterium]
NQWVKVQRRQARAGTLPVEQWWRLDALGLDWNPPGSEWNPGKHGWEARMNELRAYQSRHGHCRVPRFCAECPALARWVIAVRKRHREGKLRPERAGALEQMGFAWDAKPAQDMGRWQGQFARLVKFRERFGHCRVPAKWREDTVLGGWVGNQRAFRKRGTLSAERVAQLESVGFEWQLYSGYLRSPEERWEQMFARLLDYRREHGDTLVPPRFRGIKGLRRWVIAQRRQGDALRPDWRERLEAIGFRWGGIERSHDEQWALRLAQLLGFRQRFGHCRVPAKWKEDAALGGWVHNQRAFKKKGTLSPERIAQLEAVGFEWHDRWDTSADEHWQRMCAHVERYRQEHGHADVPPGFREVRGLNKWVVHQRQAYRLGELRGDRVAQLEAIGFAWKTTDRLNRARWERRFGQLAAYRRQYGHCRVPAKWREDAAFGAWVHTQRASKRKGTLSPERIRQLDELGFEWAG